MKILVYSKSSLDLDLLQKIEEGVKTKLCEDFHWEWTGLLSHFESAVGCLKIFASDEVPEKNDYDLIWPSPSRIVKDVKLKEVVWNSIIERVVPAFKKDVVSVKPLTISESDFQKLLIQIDRSDCEFTVVLDSGRRIFVNHETGLKSSDIAAMLAAMWIFGAKCIELE